MGGYFSIWVSSSSEGDIIADRDLELVKFGGAQGNVFKECRLFS